jgi:hypothetical protein
LTSLRIKPKLNIQGDNTCQIKMIPAMTGQDRRYQNLTNKLRRMTMTKTVTYEGEEITATFSSVGEMVDFGVPRSPVWWEPTDIEVESLFILDQEQDFDKLSAEVQDAILSLVDEFSGSDWE